MKKTALIFATLVLTATSAFAEEATNTELTLAASDIGVKTAWIETQEDAEARIAEELAETSLSLPMWPGMTEDHVAEVVAAIRRFF